jgi:hypothetical protein
MLNRWIGITTAALMLSVNTLLVVRDVLPCWLAGDPPQAEIELLQPGEQRRTQVSIYNKVGQRVGRSWTHSKCGSTLLTVDTWTVLYPIDLPRDVVTPRLSIHTNVVYHHDTWVDSLRIDVHGFSDMRGGDVPIGLRGERVPPDDFPCQWQVGEQRGTLVLDADAIRVLGDVVHPFDRLPGLYVGQAWRLELLNPLTRLLPGFRDSPVATSSVLVRVTGTESIEHNGQLVEAFRVEAEKAVAWVASDGRVLRQEVDLPLLGRLTLIDEPFDERQGYLDGAGR